MNVFDQTTGQSETNQSDTDTNQDWVAKVVGEKGDQWSDPQTLAKGYSSAQEYIKELERQTSELREDIGKKEYVEELLKQMKQGEPTAKEPVTLSDNSGTNTEGNTTLSDVESLVEQTLTKREQQRTAAENVKVANDKLEEAFGTEALKKVQERSKELGMSMDSLQAIAEQSPTAFLRLVGDAEQKETNSTIKGTLNTSAGFNQSQKRNFAYYQKMRKESSSQYYSPKVQQQMLDDRMTMGNNFYN